MQIMDRHALPDSSGSQPAEIILVKRDDAYYPWVTWQRNVPERGGDGGRYWGHYFDDESKARKDFAERVARAEGRVT